MVDVGVSVGIIPDTSGARVIKTSLDQITKESAKAEAASQRLANSQLRLVASNNSAQAAFNKSTAQIKAAENAMIAAEIRAKQLANAQNRLNEQGQKGQATFGNLKGIIAGYIGIQTVINVIKTADAYTLMNQRLKEIAGSTREASGMMAQLRSISNKTGTEIGTSLSILQRLSFVRNEINATNNDMLNFTSTITKLGVISGASQDAMKFGLTQLGQSLSSQIVRAEEFNSIMENIPAVGVKIAEGLGVTTGQLRQLVVNGKLLSSDVFAVILNQTDEINRKFEEMPMTAGKGLQVLRNAFSEIIDDINTGTDGASNLGRVLAGLGDIAKVIYIGWNGVFTMIGNGFAKAANSATAFANIVITGYNKTYGLLGGPAGGLLYARYGEVSKFEGGNLSNAEIDAESERRNKATIDRLFPDTKPLASPTKRAVSKPGGKTYAEIAAGLGTGNADKKGIAEAKRQQKELESAINGSRTEMEKLNDEVAHLESLKSVAKTTKEVELLNRGIQNTQNEIEKLRVKAELDSPLVKTFKDVADEIQDGFKDAFKSAFDGGGSTFKKFTDGIKKSFKSMLLDLAYQAAVKPIIVSVLGVAGGALGISNGALNSVLGTGGGAAGAAGTGASGIGSLSSIATSLLSGSLYSNTLSGFGIQAGNFLSGNALSTLPWASGAGSLPGLMGSAFGNFGYGAIGSLGANLLGLGGGIGGTIGGGLGTLAGGAIGSSLGTILGFAGGPIGAIAGGFLGSALGGLFGGGKPSNMAQWGGIDLATGATVNTGGQTGKKFSQANADFRDKVLGEAGNLAKLFQSVGGTTKGNLNITIGSRDGLWLHNGEMNPGGVSSSKTNFGKDSEALVKAVMQRVVSMTTGLSATFQSILNKTGVSDTAKLASNFEFGMSYDALLKGQTQSPTEALAEAIKALDANMQSMLKTATDLGLPIDKYTEALQKQKEATIGALKAQQAGFSSLEEMTRTFDNFFNGQALGDTSTLTPEQKLQVAQDNFGALLKKAQGGDYSVTQDLLSSANTLISQGRDVYASSVDYSNLEGFVRSSVKGVATAEGYNGQDVSYSIISTNQQLVTNGTNQTAAIDAMKAEIFRLSNLLTKLIGNAA